MLRLDEIQGNILIPFPKEAQVFLFISIYDRMKAKTWLKELSKRITRSDQIISQKFSSPSQISTSQNNLNDTQCYISIGFTNSGMRILSPNLYFQMNTYTAFCQGAEIRSRKLGQKVANASKNWIFGGNRNKRVDLLLNIASVKLQSIVNEVINIVSTAKVHGTTISWVQFGGRLPGDMFEREHFGFKDGISQPKVVGIDLSVEEARAMDIPHYNPPINPGEFIMGYRRGTFKEQIAPYPSPKWMRNGSFQVFMRLIQDVAGWRKQISEICHESVMSKHITEEQLAAKLIGRWPSGTPLTRSDESDLKDVTNDFNYEDDPYGYKTPHFAHARKMYPREQSSIDREWHRIIRRSLPFGPTYDPNLGPKHGVHTSRGLLMNSFMSNIERQFEFLIRAWANDSDFPEADDGPDPVLNNSAPIKLRLKSGISQKIQFNQHVFNSGAVYTFVPSISLIKEISNTVD